MTRTRWPRSVYRDGTEPDYRFSLANERTYLAWIRTALALLAAGVVLDVVELSISDRAQRLLALVLVSTGLVCALIAWVRWCLTERAMRRALPLPSFGLGAPLTFAIVVAAVLLLAKGL